MSYALDVKEKLAIHELFARAAYGLDERNLDMLKQSFATDAEMTLRIAAGDLIGPFVGQDGIMSLMKDALEAQTDKRRHVISNIFFESEQADKATVVSNLTLMATHNGEISLLSAGIYHDQVVKVGAEWKLWRRHLELDKSY
jgi:3-phenylpropionate/cinnamic acid dioxygenase small subunit